MNDHKFFNRRSLLQVAGAGMIGAAASRLGAQEPQVTPQVTPPATAKVNGHIKQSICRWCYSRIPLDKLATEAAKMGYQSIELLTPKEYLQLKPSGLTCAMIGGVSIPNGFNRKENHEKLLKDLRDKIEFAAAEGLPNVICMSGNRKGMPDEEGLENCVIGLKKIVGLAEQKKVTVCMEGLNSKVNHKDYMYDRTRWGVDLAKKVGSPRFKLLYDIYHMQIMEGDVIRTIQDYHEYIAHYHTGGVPGRHELDETQELYYPAIIKAILKTGYQGYLGQEFIPVRDPFASLAQAFRLCDV